MVIEIGYKGAPIGNDVWRMEWSCARLHHVTLLPVPGHRRSVGGFALRMLCCCLVYRATDAAQWTLAAFLQ